MSSKKKVENTIQLQKVQSEKSFDSANADNKYTFYVDCGVTKIDVRNAVEKQFNVKVTRVWTITVPGKLRKDAKFGSLKRQSDRKKAIVLLEKGNKIKDFAKI